MTKQTIEVNPISLQHVNLPNHFLNIPVQTTHAIKTLGAVLATKVFVSVIGDVFIIYRQLVAAHGFSDQSSNLQGVTDSISSLFDTTLDTYSAAQLMCLNDTTFTEVEAQSIAVVSSSSPYIYSILAISLVICLIYLLEVLRTSA